MADEEVGLKLTVDEVDIINSVSDMMRGASQVEDAFAKTTKQVEQTGGAIEDVAKKADVVASKLERSGKVSEKSYDNLKDRISGVSTVHQKMGEQVDRGSKAQGKAIASVTGEVATSRKAFGALGAGVASNMALIGGAVAAAGLVVGKLTLASIAAAEAADKQRIAELRLSQALRDRSASTNRLIRFAEELKDVTGVDDQRIIEQQTYLATLGFTADQIERVVEASLDFAAGAGISFEQAVKENVEALRGKRSELLLNIEGVEDLTAAELASGKAIDLVREAYRGQAREMAENFGQTQQLSNITNDLKEAFGELVGQPVKEFLRGVVSQFRSLKELISPTKELTSELEDQQSKYDLLFNSINTGLLTEAQHRQTIQEINSQLDQRGLSLISAKSSTDDLRAAQEQLNQSFVDEARSRVFASLFREKEEEITRLAQAYIESGKQIVVTEQDISDAIRARGLGSDEVSNQATRDQFERLLRGAQAANESGVAQARRELRAIQADAEAAGVVLDEIFGTLFEPSQVSGDDGAATKAREEIDKLTGSLESLEDTNTRLQLDEVGKIEFDLSKQLSDLDKLEGALRDLFRSRGREEEFNIKVLPRIQILRDDAERLAEQEIGKFKAGLLERLENVDLEAIDGGNSIANIGVLSPDFLELKIPPVNTKPTKEAFESLGKSIQDALDLDDAEFAAVESAFLDTYQNVFDALSANTQRQIDDNERLIQSYQDRRSEIESELAEELRLQEEGYANNVGAKQAELDEITQREQAAIQRNEELKRKAARQELVRDSLLQASNLATAITSIFQANSGIPIVGIITAIASVSAMLAAFSNFKAQTAAATRLNMGVTGLRLPKYGRSDKNGGNGRMIEGTNIMVGDGESIMTEEATQKWGYILDQMNAGKLTPEQANQFRPADAMPAQAYQSGMAFMSRQYMDTLNAYRAQIPANYQKEVAKAQREERRVDMEAALANTISAEFAKQTKELTSRMDKSTDYVPLGDGVFLKITKTPTGEKRERVKMTVA